MFFLRWPSLFIVVLLCFSLIPPTATHSADHSPQKGISAHSAADYIHAVIEADRTIYSQYIVERLGETVALQASENWKAENKLLLPAQFLMISSQIVNARNSGLSYRLMSLWPINPANSPKSALEKKGLDGVLKNPKEPFTWTVKTNGKSQFNAIYPDMAVSKSCVNCHNTHPKSPKKDFKRGDVMGGIQISFPLSTTLKNSEEDATVAPEVVADYIHSILEADRTVYAKYIVNRLQKNNIIYPSENWWEENTLLLPAQFLLNASDLIKNMRLGLDYRLISLWPINPRNGAANEFERAGLESVASQPLRPYIGKTKVGNKSYFQAVYPDIAVTPACVSCHNAHPKSPKNDFKLFDVIGGIVVSVPINQD